MSKTILVSCFMLLTSFLLVSSPALARDGAIPTLRQELKDKKEEMKNEIKEKREDNKDKNLENKRTKAQATLKRLRQGLVNRYENTLKQKTNIEARIAKIESQVVPTGKSARDLSAAKAKLSTFSDTQYKSDLAAFDAKAAEVLASTTPLKLTPELKALAKTLNGDIKAMRQVLADTLRLIIKAR